MNKVLVSPLFHHCSASVHGLSGNDGRWDNWQVGVEACGIASYPAEEIDGKPQRAAGREVQVTPCGQTPPQIDEGCVTSQKQPELKGSRGFALVQNVQKRRTLHHVRSSRCFTEPGALWVVKITLKKKEFL